MSIIKDKFILFISSDNVVFNINMNKCPSKGNLLTVKIDEFVRNKSRIIVTPIKIEVSSNVLRIIEEYINEGVIKICSSILETYVYKEHWILDDAILNQVLFILSISKDSYVSTLWMKTKLEEDWAIYNSNYVKIYHKAKYMILKEIIKTVHMILSGINLRMVTIKHAANAKYDDDYLSVAGSYGISSMFNPLISVLNTSYMSHLAFNEFIPDINITNSPELLFSIIAKDNYIRWNSTIYTSINLHNYGNGIYGFSTPTDGSIYTKEYIHNKYTNKGVSTIDLYKKGDTLTNQYLIGYIYNSESDLQNAIVDKRIPHIYKCSYLFNSDIEDMVNFSIYYTDSWLYCMMQGINLVDVSMMDDILYSYLMTDIIINRDIINVSVDHKSIPIYTKDNINTIISPVTSRPPIVKTDDGNYIDVNY